MNAVVKQIIRAPLRRPFFECHAQALYSRADFIAINRQQLAEWFMALRFDVSDEASCTFAEFCAVQYDIELARRDEFQRHTNARWAAHQRGEIQINEQERRSAYELPYDRDTGIRCRGEI